MQNIENSNSSKVIIIYYIILLDKEALCSIWNFEHRFLRNELTWNGKYGFRIFVLEFRQEFCTAVD